MENTRWEQTDHYVGVTPHVAAGRVVVRQERQRGLVIRRGFAEFEMPFYPSAGAVPKEDAV